MTDYDAVNARLLAERNIREEAERAAKNTTQETLRLLDEAEQLATQFHQFWHSQDFADFLSAGKIGRKYQGKVKLSWLHVEGTEKLAHNLDIRYNGDEILLRPHVYIMIDGRLVYYYRKAVGSAYVAASSGTSRPYHVDFSLYREYIEEHIALGRDMLRDVKRDHWWLTDMVNAAESVHG